MLPGPEDGGALLATPQFSQRYRSVPMPDGSGVGAGDAMVAGITVGLSRGWTLQESVRLGMAAGAATLMTPGSEPCRRADVERLFEVVPRPVEVAYA